MSKELELVRKLMENCFEALSKNEEEINFRVQERVEDALSDYQFSVFVHKCSASSHRGVESLRASCPDCREEFRRGA